MDTVSSLVFLAPAKKIPPHLPSPHQGEGR
jgi:hypothetical protein